MAHWVYANEYVSLELERLSHERGEVAGLHSITLTPPPPLTPLQTPTSTPTPTPPPTLTLTLTLSRWLGCSSCATSEAPRSVRSRYHHHHHYYYCCCYYHYYYCYYYYLVLTTTPSGRSLAPFSRWWDRGQP